MYGGWDRLGQRSTVFQIFLGSRKRRSGVRKWIVASFQLRPSNSGGPLLPHAEGWLVGINTKMARLAHVAKVFLRREFESEQGVVAA